MSITLTVDQKSPRSQIVMDRTLVLSVLSLLGFSAVMVFSATLGTHGLWLSDVRAFESGSVAKRLNDGEIAKPAEWTSLFVHFRRPAVRSANDEGDLLERWEAEQCEIARAGGDGFVVSFGTT